MTLRSLVSAFSAAVIFTTACGPKAKPQQPPPSAPVAVAPAPAAQQPPRPSVAPAVANGVPAITEATIRAHLEFLASDAMNGRGSGTRDEWIAATYVASQFRKWGLEPMGDDGGFVQQIEMRGMEATAPPVLTAGSLKLTHGVGMIVQGLGASAKVSGPLVKFKSGVTVPAGAVVFAAAPLTPQDRAAIANAAIVITPAPAQTLTNWAALAPRMPLSPVRAVKLPAAAPAAIRIILDASATQALTDLTDSTPVTFEATVKPTEARYTWNAVGRLTGSEAPQEVIVLSAHLDHLGARPTQPGVDTIFNGADDDASGTVAVMALAEALSRGPRLKRTLVFAAFGSEETGGAGAGFFVDLPVVPLNQIVADLQFEMLGRADPMVPPNHLWLTGFERSNLGPELAKQGAALVNDPRPAQSFFTRSDNIRFARRGVIAHTVSSFNLHTDYHRASDEIRLIDFPYMTASIQSMLEPIRWLASATFKPAWVEGGCPAPCK